MENHAFYSVCNFVNKFYLVVALLWLASVQPAHAIPLHPHGPAWNLWGDDDITTNVNNFEFDGDPGTGTVIHDHPGFGAENGDSAHQHYIPENFKGNDNTGEPFSAYGAWDNRTEHLDATDPFGDLFPVAGVPHGFIQPGSEPRYRYVGANWETDDNAKDARSLIDIAFGVWSSIGAQVSPLDRGGTGKKLMTGFGFEPANGNDAEIDILWTDISDDLNGGAFSTIGGDLQLKFDSMFAGNPFNWDFTAIAEDSNPDMYHFLSVALHEIGHIGFLEHQLDAEDDLMTAGVGLPVARDGVDEGYRWSGFHDAPGENDFFLGQSLIWDPAATEFSFTPIQDRDSPDAIKSLYSIPAPEPAILTLFGLGLAVIASVRRRQQKTNVAFFSYGAVHSTEP